MSEVTFEDLKPRFRPTGVHPGIMKFDRETCTKCGLCVQNCPFVCLENDADDIPVMKGGNVGCFSCFNCMVVCPVDGCVEIVDTWHVDGPVYNKGWPGHKMPLEPRDAEGDTSEWNVVERTVLERRSVRNFKDEPVSDHMIRRILEAGRFAPSATNGQPWKFAVVTDPALLAEIEGFAHAVWSGIHAQYNDDAQAVDLYQALGGDALPVGGLEPRGFGRGLDCIVSKELPSYFGAPCVIFIATNDEMFSPDLHVGIAGQNMNIVAQSLGLGTCWSGFGTAPEYNPDLKVKLGFEDGWRIATSLCIGHPEFKQKGLVKRQYRPVTWLRPGGNGPEVED
ncbi:MAG: 4Fe-4S binding protein [Deltaproteobacteria bacterium]|jgi:nitroreductase|nr:4Fe-4S binding protein [Deltaproteobacteria bacterium]